MDKTKIEKSCSKVNVFKRLKGKVIIKYQDNSLKISQTTKWRNEEKDVNKQRTNPSKIRHHSSTHKRFSSMCQHKENSLMVKKCKVSKEINTKVDNGQVPKASHFQSKIISTSFGTYKLKCCFDLFTPVYFIMPFQNAF